MDDLTKKFRDLSFLGKPREPQRQTPGLYLHTEGDDMVRRVKKIKRSPYPLPRNPDRNKIWRKLRKIKQQVNNDGKHVYTIHVGHGDERVVDYQMRTSLSGKLKVGEHRKDGARRELMEETGLLAKCLIDMGTETIDGRTEHYFIAQIGERPIDMPTIEYDERPDDLSQKVYVLAWITRIDHPCIISRRRVFKEGTSSAREGKTLLFTRRYIEKDKWLKF
jgi:hypothetical protein